MFDKSTVEAQRRENIEEGYVGCGELFALDKVIESAIKAIDRSDVENSGLIDFKTAEIKRNFGYYRLWAMATDAQLRQWASYKSLEDKLNASKEEYYFKQAQENREYCAKALNFFTSEVDEVIETYERQFIESYIRAIKVNIEHPFTVIGVIRIMLKNQHLNIPKGVKDNIGLFFEQICDLVKDNPINQEKIKQYCFKIIEQLENI
jgi:hypothetical protein